MGFEGWGLKGDLEVWRLAGMFEGRFVGRFGGRFEGGLEARREVGG